MATLTRTTIKARVNLNTGRSDKDTLIEYACDDLLKEACNEHDFEYIIENTEVQTTADQAYVDLPSGFLTLVSAAIVEKADGTTVDNIWNLTVKGRQWWASHIIDASKWTTGDPAFAMLDIANSRLYLAKVPSGTEFYIQLRYTVYPSFATDATENPIPLLDNWIVARCTEEVFDSLEQFRDSKKWGIKAVKALHHAKRMNKRHSGKERKREERARTPSDNNPVGDVIRTTGLYEQNWS
jgi:hypothetical protein